MSAVIYLHGEYLLLGMLLKLLGIAAAVIIFGLVARKFFDLGRWERKNQPKPYYPRSGEDSRSVGKN